MIALAINVPPSADELAHIPRNGVHDLIEALMARLDEIDGDPDVELNGDENDDPGDLGDAAWIEWTTMRGAAKRGPNDYGPQGGFGPGIGEDTEEDDGDTSVEDHPQGFDPEEDMCLAGDDRVCSGAVIPGIHGNKYDGPGDADDAEYDEMNMPDSVPTLPVYAIEPNPFDGKREYLGHSNLQPSFVSNGEMMKGVD